MKTIRRNAHRKIAAIALTIVRVKRYDPSTGNMVDSTVEGALGDLKRFDFAKFYDYGNGKYVVHVHSNLWFDLYTQAHLDRAAAENAAREARQDARDAERAEQRNTPAVTVTRTRMAIGDQIAQACEALGIELGHGWSKGAACYEVNGKNYTAGELADLVLEGGFAANYGGNEVRVNWDSPLAPGQTQERRAGRALKITRELQARMGASTARELEEVAQTLMDMLHGWAIEDAPREKVDFPSGAAEPGPEVTAVQCVATGKVLRRNAGVWVDRWGSGCTWYRMNEIDPMSEGFRIYREES